MIMSQTSSRAAKLVYSAVQAYIAAVWAYYRATHIENYTTATCYLLHLLLAVVKATALKQQIISKFYPQFPSTETSYRIYASRCVSQM